LKGLSCKMEVERGKIGDEFMNKNLIKRISKIERVSRMPRWRLEVKDFAGLYRGDCGENLSREQFDLWVSQQDADTQIIIVEVCGRFSSGSEDKTVVFKVENHAYENLSDMLKGYDEALNRAVQATILANTPRAETAELAPKPEGANLQ
jgi:hypothetical protein